MTGDFVTGDGGNRSDDVRPFFGKQAEVIEAPSWLPQVRGRRFRDYAERADEIAEARIQRGECGRPGTPGCVGRLDDQGGCPVCGWSVTQWYADDRRADLEADLLEPVTSRQPFLTGWQFVDEYAPADEDAA